MVFSKNVVLGAFCRIQDEMKQFFSFSSSLTLKNPFWGENFDQSAFPDKVVGIFFIPKPTEKKQQQLDDDKRHKNVAFLVGGIDIATEKWVCVRVGKREREREEECVWVRKIGS